MQAGISQGGRWAEGFPKIREEETIAWAGRVSVTSTDQRQSNRLKGQRCWEGTDGPVQGQGGNERQNEGRIFEHHWEMRLKLLCKRYQRIEQIPKGKRPCDYALKSTRENEMNRKEKKR